MSNIIELQKWIIEALVIKNGRATLLEVCKIVWAKHENELKLSGDLFYTWQYEIRWAATELRKKGILKPAEESKRGIWELA